MVRKILSGVAVVLSLFGQVAMASPSEMGPYLNLGLQHVPSDENDRIANDAWGVFAGGGVPLNKWFAVEGDMFYDKFDSYAYNPQSATWKEYGAEAAGLLTLPIGNGWVPFFSMGAGVTKSTLETSPSQSSVDLAYALGAGTFYLFNAFDRQWGLRFDARYRVTSISDSPFGGSISGFNSDIGEGVFRFGMLMGFGGKQEAPAPVEKIEPTPPPAVVIGEPEESKAPIEIVYFDFDKSNIKPAEAAKLDKAIGEIAKLNEAEIVIRLAGHTDSFGTEEYNIGLGERRGLAVKDYLVSHGVKASDIRVDSYGETKPAQTNDTAAGRAMNRRVEIFVSGN